jgi:hypothetical protein
MIDAIHANVGNIPASTPKVAGYVTGTPDIQWTAQDWELFPQAGTLRIDQSPRLAEYASNAASVADIELGAGTVGAFVTASQSRLGLGRLLWCYGTATTLAQVSAALTAAGIPLDMCGAWLANWDLSEAEADAALGTAVAGIRLVGVQWASPTSNPATQVPGSTLTLAQAQVDLSVTVPGWFAAHTLAPARAEAEVSA